eukprot:4342136-Alexandrium_andersonii.AAC.1
MPPLVAGAQASKTYRDVCSWIAADVARVPARSMPLICCDANAKIGYHYVDGLPHLSQSPAVGDCQPD